MSRTSIRFPETAGGPEIFAIGSFRISVVRGPDEGLVYLSEGERTVVGTHPSADVCLSDRRVSRFHCELVVDERGVRLHDLDSRNGTRVDSVWVEVARLSGPVVLSIGNTQLRFEEVVDSISIELTESERFGTMVGVSDRMRSIFALLQRVAPAGSNVLFEGESGVGKGIAAQNLHEQGMPADAPFGVVDCSEPDPIVRAELFGTESQPSALTLCSGGTLVLDDVGSLSYDTQLDLWSAMQKRAVPTANAVVPFDTRVAATTRRNLRRAVNAGHFSSDLYSVLAPLRVQLPPLREHLQDIPALVCAFLRALGVEDSPVAQELMADASIESLRGYRWPGNVTELRRHVERCVLLRRAVTPADGDDAHMLPVIDTSIPLRVGREEWIRYFERRYLSDMLERTEGNVTAAARKAGIDRVHFYRLLKAAGLR